MDTRKPPGDFGGLRGYGPRLFYFETGSAIGAENVILSLIAEQAGAKADDRAEQSADRRLPYGKGFFGTAHDLNVDAFTLGAFDLFAHCAALRSF